MRLINAWRRFARWCGAGCATCGRMTFARSMLCRRHLSDAMDRAIADFATEEV